MAPGRRNRCKADRVDAELALDWFGLTGSPELFGKSILRSVRDVGEYPGDRQFGVGTRVVVVAFGKVRILIEAGPVVPEQPPKGLMT